MNKKTGHISSGDNYTAAEIGKLDELSDHSYVHPLNGNLVKGKIFLKELTGATGTEISLQALAPHTELSYFHIHYQNEETYLFLKGSGDFQVDNDCFPVKEGSVVRVSPAGIRSLRNSGDEPMVYMVIQSREGSLKQYSFTDGKRLEHQVLWHRE